MSKISADVITDAIRAWTTLDLASLQKILDEKALELQDSQKSSLLGRKKLASKTKEFKKLADEERLVEVNGLIKMYQGQIDDLTKKSKSIETVFYQIYRSLLDVTDPTPLFQQCIKELEASKELDSLRKENQVLEERLLGFADYEQLKCKMREMEVQGTKSLNSYKEVKQKEFDAILEEKRQQHEGELQQLRDSNEDFKKKMNDFQVSNEVLQLKLKQHSRALQPGEEGDNDENEAVFSENMAFKRASFEYDMLSREAQASKTRLLEIERRNLSLVKELGELKSSNEEDKVVNEYAEKIQSLESDTARLTARLESERKSAEREKGANQQTTKNLTREVEGLTQEITSLKTTLRQTSDYAELKKELEVLKDVQFGSETLEADNQVKGNENRLEGILLQRNKKLSNELIEHRNREEELVKRLNHMQVQVDGSAAEIERVSKLNHKLEYDLTQLQGDSNWETGSTISAFSNALTAPKASEKSSILPIVTQQRDRFRTRNKELEQDLKNLKAQLNDQKSKVDSVNADNKDLYQRIRYLSSHNSQPAQARDPENKYKENYEMELHPIEQFRQSETKRINAELPPTERVFISVVRFILSTSTSRYLFVGYCFTLHFLIMVMFVHVMNLHTYLTPNVSEGLNTGGKSMQEFGSS